MTLRLIGPSSFAGSDPPSPRSVRCTTRNGRWVAGDSCLSAPASVHLPQGAAVMAAAKASSVSGHRSGPLGMGPHRTSAARLREILGPSESSEGDSLMARENQQVIIETAATLLQQIKTSAESTVDPASLLQLAEAFSLVINSNPRKPPTPPRIL